MLVREENFYRKVSSGNGIFASQRESFQRNLNTPVLREQLEIHCVIYKQSKIIVNFTKWRQGESLWFLFYVELGYYLPCEEYWPAPCLSLSKLYPPMVNANFMTSLQCLVSMLTSAVQAVWFLVNIGSYIENNRK